MNRDIYHTAPGAPPSHGGNRPAAAAAGAGATGQMSYECAECGAKVGINKGEQHIRCKECGGHRVLYKQKTRRCMVQFEAR